MTSPYVVNKHVAELYMIFKIIKLVLDCLNTDIDINCLVIIMIEQFLMNIL